MTLVLPIYWTKGKLKPKTSLVGMNLFRNQHHFDQAAMKRYFHDLVEQQLPTPLPTFDTYTMSYDIYYKSPVCDGSNIVALIEKFALDALVSAGIVPDDTVKYHLGSTWQISGQDKLNPRIEVTITTKDTHA